ncbi:MAG: 3-oxoacyl-[acyl-carrier-protein] synthase III C-terminal domain-containing protein, partial [Actinomycetota bacterium]
PSDRVFVDLEEVGNTSAASVPIALDHAWRAGKVKPGDVVLTAAFGAGLAWGANLIRWTAEAPR